MTIKSHMYEWKCIYLYYYRRRVCVFAKLDQFLPVHSHFDTKRPVNFFHIATFPSPTFGPLFAFHCPLFFTKNNNLECRDVLKTVTVTCVCVQNLTNFWPISARTLSFRHSFKSLKNRKCSESVSIGVIDEVRSAKRWTQRYTAD